MTRRSIDYHDFLIDRLRNPSFAAIYLNGALEEGDPKYFLKALRNVAEAMGGMMELSKKTKLNRANLYRMMSNTGNPELYSLLKLLKAMGFELEIKAHEESRFAA